MMWRRILLATLFAIFTCGAAQAETFVVTSNADSGPGTLRDALTKAAANGTADQDQITFNLPVLTEAGRTITLLSILPDISSNVVIDASTQPGPAFGTSDAKVEITVDKNVYFANNYNYDAAGALMLVNVTDVEIYSLYITGFNELKSAFDGVHTAAIYCANAKNIKIGAPGKGNVLFNNDYAIRGRLAGAVNENFLIQSNYICLDPNGQNELSDSLATLGIDLNADVVTIGGSLGIESNYFGYCEYGISNKGHSLNIINNYYGVDRNGTVLKHNGIFYTAVVIVEGPVAHIIGNQFSTLSLSLNSVSTFEVYANIDHADPIYSSNAIIIQNSSNGAIGYPDDNFKNVFRGNLYAPAIVNANSTNIQLYKNSIYCTGDAYDINNGQNAPLIQVLVNNDAEFSGTAPANSTVYIYEDNTGCSVCSPVVFYTTTQADAAGKWKITGNFTGKRFVANALDQLNSTAFTQPIIDPSNSVITVNASCGLKNGSVEITKYSNILSFEWFDTNDQKVGDGAKVTGLGPGAYYAIGHNGNCSARLASPVTVINVDPLILDGGLQKTDPSCNTPGSIKGLAVTTDPQGATTYAWTDKSNAPVGNTLDLNNLPAGEYTLTLKFGAGCSKTYGPVVLANGSDLSIDQTKRVVNPSKCYNSTGSITGITGIGTNITYSWKDASGQEVSTLADLIDKPAGFYTLTITGDDNCGTASSDPIEIKSVNDIVINEAGKQVIFAHCNDYDGSITNIKVNVPGVTYSWTDGDGKPVGYNSPDLLGVKAGFYTLTVTDGTACEPVKSSVIEVKSIDGVKITGIAHVESERCEGNNGSITGLTAVNATTVVWRNEARAVVGDKIDLKDKPAGRYYISISNSTCSDSTYYDIGKLVPIIYPDFPTDIIPACSDLFTNGKITINTENAPSQPFGYIWEDSKGTEIGYGKTIEGLAPGNYKLYLIDGNGCRVFYKEYTVGRYPDFAYMLGATTNIQCGVGLGKIGAPQLSGGRGEQNYVYSWYAGWDLDDKIIPGENKSTLDNVPAGKYRLHIEDGGCSNYDLRYEILDYDLTPPPPVVPDLRLSGAGSAQLLVTDPYPTAIYNLYDSETSITPTDSEIGGKFNIFPTENRSYYVSLTYGRCESTRTKVSVFLCLTSKDIANTFSPNGDGTNDYWNIKGLEFNTNATVQVFNRSGILVYQSRGYSKPFDGTYKGKQLPFGTYYYIIETGTECGKFAGSLTILR